jgi:hypothetical protein
MDGENWTEWFPTEKGRENQAMFSDLGYNDEVRAQQNGSRNLVVFRVLVAHADYLLVKRSGRHVAYMLPWNKVLHFRRRIKE